MSLDRLSAPPTPASECVTRMRYRQVPTRPITSGLLAHDQKVTL